MNDKKPDKIPDQSSGKLPRLAPGRPIPAATMDAFIGAVEEAGNMALSGGLGATKAAGNTAIKLDRAVPFDAIVSGPTSPYTWREVYLDRDTDPPTWKTLAGGRSGTANAYEYNGAVRLDGKAVRLTPVGGSWFKFVHPRKGSAHAPPPCPMTVQFFDCGVPTGGAILESVGFNPGPPATYGPVITTGTTDGDGLYTFPDTVGPYLQITYDGLTSRLNGQIAGLAVFNCANPLPICYYHAKVSISTTAGATVNFSDIPPGFVITGDGSGGILLTFKHFYYCSEPPPFPVTFNAHVGMPIEDPDWQNWLDNCQSVDVDCGDEVAVDVPIFRWADDYARRVADCDQGCELRGEGPLYRGLAPKVLQVIPGTISGPGLGALDGVPVTLTWDAANRLWDSGCIPDPGVRCNPNDPYATPRFYHSARLQIFGSGSTPGPLFLYFYETTDCGPVPPGTTAFCGNAYIIAGGAKCVLASPVDGTMTGNGVGIFAAGIYRFDITE
jgi:hypothetical protein